MRQVRDLRNELERKKGQRDQVAEHLAGIKADLGARQDHLVKLEKAQVIVQEVAQLTQKELEFHVSDLVSSALATVFNDPYQFQVEFVVRRDKTEADLIWRHGESCYLPNGGGVRDVSAFALRVALWSLREKRSRPVLILDEPFKHLKPSALQERAGAMLKEISAKLGLQIIMVTHDEALVENADAVYRVTKKGGVSDAKKESAGLQPPDRPDDRGSGEEQPAMDVNNSPGVQTRAERGRVDHGKHHRVRPGNKRARGATGGKGKR